MYRQVPNLLTLLRLLLAAAFFIVLNRYRYADAGPGHVLIVALVLFVFAALTDILDGHLARRWQVESKFGRIMDPFCDKVLVIGAFIYLMGERFVIPDRVESGATGLIASGVYPWMVVVILARELLVTGIRGEMEGSGVRFGAVWSGKLKMILQSIVVPVVLLIVYLDPEAPGHAGLRLTRDILVYLTVIVTVVSGLPYLVAATRVMKREPDGGAGS